MFREKNYFRFLGKREVCFNNTQNLAVGDIWTTTVVVEKDWLHCMNVEQQWRRRRRQPEPEALNSLPIVKKKRKYRKRSRPNDNKKHTLQMTKNTAGQKSRLYLPVVDYNTLRCIVAMPFWLQRYSDSVTGSRGRYQKNNLIVLLTGDSTDQYPLSNLQSEVILMPDFSLELHQLHQFLYKVYMYLQCKTGKYSTISFKNARVENAWTKIPTREWQGQKNAKHESGDRVKTRRLNVT